MSKWKDAEFFVSLIARNLPKTEKQKAEEAARRERNKALGWAAVLAVVFLFFTLPKLFR